MTSQRERCTKLIIERLLEVYGVLHAVTMAISYDDRDKLNNVTDIVDSAIRLIESLVSGNRQDKKLCKRMATATAMLIGLKRRICTIMQKEYKAPKGVADRQQREELATPTFNKLHDISQDVFGIMKQTSSKQIKESFERVSDSVFSAISELNTFVTNDPITEALREDLYSELKRLINETYSIKCLLQENNKGS